MRASFFSRMLFVMKKSLIVMIFTAAWPLQLFASTLPLKGAQYASHAKITLVQARTKALKAEPGTIIAQELEKEKGSLRYSFDIKVSGVVHEVGIDATTGKIVEDSTDDEKDKDVSR